MMAETCVSLVVAVLQGEYRTNLPIKWVEWFSDHVLGSVITPALSPWLKRSLQRLGHFEHCTLNITQRMSDTKYTLHSTSAFRAATVTCVHFLDLVCLES